jgi:hypothetical protein
LTAGFGKIGKILSMEQGLSANNGTPLTINIWFVEVIEINGSVFSKLYFTCFWNKKYVVIS